MTGFEHGDASHILRDKILSNSGGGSFATTTPTPHQNATYGGAKYRKYNGNPSSEVFTSFTPLTEYVACFAAYFTNSTTTFNFGMRSADGTIQNRVVMDANTANIAIHRNTTALATSSSSVFTIGQWNWIHYWAFINDTTGFGHVRVGSYSNLVVSATGVDTKAHASDSTAAHIGITSVGTSGVSGADDIMVFARSMYFSSATGSTPVVGATITGGTSAATAIITHVYTSGADGVFFVRTVSGTFVAAETITSGGWSATAGNGLGNNQDSLWVREQYILLRTVNSDSSVAWTSSTGASHYTEVDDSATTSDFVSTNTNAQLDEYGTTGSLPPGAEIEAVNVTAYARLNGVSAVNNIVPGLKDGSGNTYDLPANSALSGAYEVHDIIVGRKTGGSRFSDTDVTNSKARITSAT